ncbi:MAG: hypothetical protein PHR35_11515 [Kiritimatiellae bacterium]|nr:hypothetical protein [Kiritimatiellia bacterium]
MSVDNRKCFESAASLKRFEPVTLCRFLSQYPGYVKARLGGLPDVPMEENMPYDKIVAMFIDTGEETPGDFLEKMVLIIEMATPVGHQKLVDEADRMVVPYESFHGKTFHDTAMRAAMLPGDLLDRAHARVVIFKKRRFTYYLPVLGALPPFTKPTAADLEKLAAALTLAFHGTAPKIRAKVLFFDFPNEAWFVVRRGGQPMRLGVWEGEDTVSKFLVPEAYDGIVYNKRHGELRIISKAEREYHLGYMRRFGELLTGDAAFFGLRTVFHPEVVATMRRDTLVWTGNSKIASIRLAGLGYQMPGGGIVKRTDPRCLLRENDGGGRLVPPRAEKVLYAEFKFKMLRDKYERSVRVEAGSEATYLRDSDVALIEEWLRQNRLMFMGAEPKVKDEKAA